MFDKNGGLQALIQYPGKDKNWLLYVCSFLNSIRSFNKYLYNLKNLHAELEIQKEHTPL